MDEFDADTWARRTRENARITGQEPDVAALVERLQSHGDEYGALQNAGYGPSAELMREAAAALTRLSEDRRLTWQQIGGLQARAEKAEAALAERQAHWGDERERAEKAEAERDQAAAGYRSMFDHAKRLEMVADNGAVLALKDANDRAEKAEAALAEAKRADLQQFAGWAAVAERDKRIAELEAEVTRLREALKTADAGILPMAVRKKVRAALKPGELP